jgi:LuxR family quorum-sensing system transcriptional regulator SolR
MPGEMLCLMDIAAGLTDTAYEVARLGTVIGKITALIPFDRCLLAHERQGTSGSMTFSFEALPAQLSCAPTVEFLEFLSISRYLDVFAKDRHFQRAFVWRCFPPQGESALLSYVRRRRFDQGVAATVTSTACTENHEVTTLMQLQCGTASVSEKQLFFLNAIVYYMHIFLTHTAWPNCMPCAQDLTLKEREVLQWMSQGKTAWEIGRILAISERTVKFHLHNVYAKLDVANRAQAVNAARRLKLT